MKITIAATAALVGTLTLYATSAVAGPDFYMIQQARAMKQAKAAKEAEAEKAVAAAIQCPIDKVAVATEATK